jgi:hypothetical protein
MPIARKRLSLTAPARDFLVSELKAIAGSSRSSLQSRADRIAVTYRPRRQGRDAIPEQPIPIDQFQLLALSYRWSDAPRRGPRWRIALGSYRATLDLPVSGRVVFRCQRAWDLTKPSSLIKPRPHYTAIRTGVLLHRAIQDADAPDLATGLRLPKFFFGFDSRRPPRFDHVDLPAAVAAERVIDGLRTWPAESFFRDGRTTLERAPSGVFASLADLKGRQIENPAFAVLRDHGLLPARLGYQAWLSTISLDTDEGRVLEDPRAEGTEGARIRKAIEDYIVSEPARESRLLGDLAEASHAMGVKLAEGPEGIDELAGILDNPWSRLAVPYAAGVQVLKLAGSPDPATMTITDAVADVDLFDLGPLWDRFRPVLSEGPRRRA